MDRAGRMQSALLSLERRCFERLAAGAALADVLETLLSEAAALFGPDVCCRIEDHERVAAEPHGHAVPIEGLDGAPLGVLLIAPFTAGCPDGEQRSLAEMIARSVALLVDRDRTMRTLRERGEELARVQRAAKAASVVVDVSDGLKNSKRSAEYAAIHGIAPHVDDAHEEWVDRLHPEDRDAALARFLDAIGGGDTRYASSYRIVRPTDGAVRWIEVEAEIERDAEGRAQRLVGVHMDVTERALAEAGLRESEARFRLIADSAPVPMWMSRLDGKRAFANQAYLDFLGLDYEAALAFDWRTALHPDDLARILQEQIAGESSRKPFVLEARYRRADGPWRWMRSESQPRWDASGKHIGFIGVAHDITASKEAEIELRRLNDTLEQRIQQRTAQLQANEAKLRAIFETSNQYQALLDRQGRLLYANATALAGIGSPADDLAGMPFWETPWFSATEGVRELVLDAFAAAISGESTRSEMVLQLPIGERSFDFTMRPIFTGVGVISGVLAEAIDVTERRRNEDALRQSQKMEAVGQLTGGVAHDFNNLLTIIRSATDFLRRRELSDERRRRYIDAISDTVDRASRLTGQLLAFARRQPLTPTVFNVGTQVETIAQLIRPLVGAGLRISLELDAEPCFATADVAQFETALVNLVVNARDAMAGEGGLTIAVRCADGIPALRTQSRRDGAFIAVSVTDTGCGIAPQLLETIFEPFFTTKQVGKGTGLGLSQAFGFAQQSGGEIAVASAPGEGATFTIYLPQAEVPEAADAVAPLPHEKPASGRGHRILVVEDDEEVGRFSTELLVDLGYAIRRVGNGQDALAALAEDEGAFDMVFSDVIMPGMNGVDLAHAIRERYPDLPVVLTSGYSHVLAENAPRDFDLVQKPYSVEALSRTLRRAIAARRSTMT